MAKGDATGSTACRYAKDDRTVPRDVWSRVFLRDLLHPQGGDYVVARGWATRGNCGRRSRRVRVIFLIFRGGEVVVIFMVGAVAGLYRGGRWCMVLLWFSGRFGSFSRRKGAELFHLGYSVSSFFGPVLSGSLKEL